MDKEKVRAYNKVYNKQYKAKRVKRDDGVWVTRSAVRNREVRKQRKKYILEYLLEHPCVDCGNDNPIVLEFDHVRGKKLNNVANLTVSCCSIKKLQDEIDKCEVRCANCHRITTYNRRLLALKSENQ